MKRIFQSTLFVALFGLLLNGCATAPRHPSLKEAQLPDLIPLRHLVANKETKFGYRISPDGRKLGWIAVKNRRLTIHIKKLGEDDVTAIIPAAPGNVYGFVWTPDSHRLLYWQDQAGNENYHIYLTDINFPTQNPIDLTPFENTRAGFVRKKADGAEGWECRL